MEIKISEPLFDLDELAKKQNGNGTKPNGNGLAGQDILTVSQFDTGQLERIFERAREMREMVRRIGGTDLLKGRVLACLFYEPSTRTSASFIAAMERLGGSVIPITEGVNSLREQRRVPARHHPHPGTVQRRDRPAPSRGRLGPGGRRLRPRADHQRRRRAAASIPPRRCWTCSPSRTSWARSTA